MSGEDITTLKKPKKELLIFTCPQCNREFNHKGPFMRHFKSCKNRSNPANASKVIGIDTSRKPLRVQRLRRSNKPATVASSLEESFQCPVCQQNFFRIGNLLRHFKNSACSSNPSLSHLNVQPSSFKKKRNSEVNNNVVTYPCPHCHKIFGYKCSLKHHMKIHSQLVDHFTCRICKKKFRHGYELESHYKTHAVKRLSMCRVCGENFKNRWSLQLHLQSHKSEGFRANATSRNAKDYRYSCHFCGKSFADKEQSEEHMKVHMLMSTHSCHMCGNEYTTRNSLYRHIQVAHLEEPNQVMYDSDSNLDLEEDLDEEDKLLGENQNGAEAGLPLQGCSVTSSVPASSRQLPAEPDSPGSARLDDNTLCHKVQRFISLLMDNVTLQELIEPGVPVATVLEKVIKYYGLTPVDCNKYPNGEGLRKNCRLLFAALLDDETVDELLIYFMKVASGRLS